MREILFRGKRKSDGEWVTGYPLKMIVAMTGLPRWYILNQEYVPETGMLSPGITMHEVIPETVGEFTGETDWCQKKIFEGDLVQRYKIEFKPPRRYKQPFKVWHGQNFPPTVDEYYSVFDHFTERVAYEVVGNEFDMTNSENRAN